MLPSRAMAHGPVNRPETRDSSTFQPYVPASRSLPEFTIRAVILGVSLRAAVRSVHGLSGTARRADGRRLDSDRGARNLGAQEAWRIVDPREQHRSNDRIGRRIARRRRRLHHSRAHLPDAQRSQLFQLRPDHDADVCRRHPRRADDGAAAPRAHRQGTRRAALPRRDGVRRSPGRG